MKKILITGGLGYIGGRLSSKLSKSYSVLVSSRRELTETEFDGSVSFIPANSLLDINSFPEDIFAVIHLAAINEIDSAKSPSLAIEVNIGQTRTILEHAIQKGVKKFIYFSTAHVYGKSLRGDVDEETLPRPHHTYAITHRAAEDYVLAANETGKITGYVVRLSNSYGAPLFPSINRWSLLVNDISRQAVSTKKIVLNSNGCQYRDFITLTDTISATIFLLELGDTNGNGIFNLSVGKSMTVIEMSRLVAQACNEVLSIEIPILLPKDSKQTNEIFYRLLPQHFQRLGFSVRDDFRGELSNLISFCHRHFHK
jgi:UDP-glucose 4-epimerase